MPVTTRRTALRLAGALTGVAVLGACRGRPSTAPTTSGPAPTSTVVSRRRTGLLERWQIRTDAVPQVVAVNVLLPASYDTGGRRYPVLYLLHGSTGSADSWLASGRLRQLLAARDVIVVMPDGGAQGWYLDWARTDPPARWESLHIRTVLPGVDRAYRTHADRAGRAVAGFSMGGFGAIHYAQAHPDLFAAASSYSGAVSLREPTDVAALDAQQVDDKPPHAIFGDDPQARVEAVDPPAHVGALRSTRVRLYCGNAAGDRQEQWMLGANKVFAGALSDAGLPAELALRPGGHAPQTWEGAFAEDLPGLLRALTPSR